MAQVIGIGAPTRARTRPSTTPPAAPARCCSRRPTRPPRGITIYGQEMDVATWALARMNMILHGHPTAELWRGNTLSAPHFKNKDGSLKTFDFAVANPPFSAKAWSSGLDPANDEFGRFEYGIPPAKNGDYAFLLHLITSLKSTGKGAIILPHGVLFRGNKEADIRRNLVQRGLIKGIIGLPANLFYGTGIPACIVVIDKEHAHARTGIFMIDASKGFLKDGNKNRLREPGHPQDRGRVQPPDRAAALLAHGAGGRDREPGQRLQPQHPALHRLERAGGPARPRRAPERRHPEPRHRRARTPTGASSRRCARRCSRTATAPGYSEPRVAAQR